MDFLKTFLAVLAGMLVGAMLVYSRPAKATAGSVLIVPAHINLHNPVSGNVVGFSCVSEDNSTDCYLAVE